MSEQFLFAMLVARVTERSCPLTCIELPAVVVATPTAGRSICGVAALGMSGSKPPPGLGGDGSSATETGGEHLKGERTRPRVSTGTVLKPGDIVADRFRILRFIARGGMSEVYEAHDLRLDAPVALKTLRPEVASDPEALERLQREIHLARKVTHHNVCRIFDVFEHTLVQSDGTAGVITGLTMELLSGETLSDRLGREGPMPLEDCLTVVRQMATALTAAHEAGVVHRDFKASNVMLVPPTDGEPELRVVVTDFGLARVAPGMIGYNRQLTAVDVVMGTADYMSPEQAQGKPATPASDIYALGIVMFEMLTGTRPHADETPVVMLVKRVKEPPPPPSSVIPGLDPRWEAAIMGCLERDPADRFGSADGVIPVLEGRSGIPVSSGVRERRRRALLGWTATAVVVAAAAIGLLVRRGADTLPVPAMSTVQLTTSPALEVDPVFSPTDDVIAFSANRTGRFEIYVRELGPGGKEMQVTDDGEQNFQPTWSPDGERIAYASHGREGIWVVPAYGGRSRRLADYGSHPAWSPDGKWVVFQGDVTAELSANAVHALPPSCLWKVSVTGGQPRALTQPGQPTGGHGAPTWSPDGSKIAFAVSDRRWSQVWTVTLEGEDLEPVVTNIPVAYDPVWSHDGRWLYFSAVTGGERYGVWRIPVSQRKGTAAGRAEAVVSLGMASIRQFALSSDGLSMVHTALSTVSNLRYVTVDPVTGRRVGPPMALTRGSGRYSRPAFSPDGSTIAFDAWKVGANQDVWISSSDGGSVRQLTFDGATDTQPSWLPGGREVVFFSERSDGFGLWAVGVDGDNSRRLTVLDRTVDCVRVSPDGERIAYHAPGPNGVINIWVANLDGSEPRQLTFADELMGFACWSSDGEWLAFEARLGDDDQIMVVSSHGGKPQQLTAGPGRSWPYGWSPDGEKVTFAGLRDGLWNVWWVSRLTGESHSVTDHGELNAYVRYPAWSPRGDRIVYELAETTGDLWLVENLP